MHQPLADKMRPSRLSDVIGQTALLGENGLLPRLLQAGAGSGFFPSLILWGPPGCGKTTLARIIAAELGRDLHEFSAVNASVKDVEAVIRSAAFFPSRKQISLDLSQAGPPIVFIDEIHRFNKSQQDSLLPHVERGSIVLLGATTENPSFSVIAALLSRCRVLSLAPLSITELAVIVDRGLADMGKQIEDDAREFLLSSAHGDARVLLTVLEISSHLAGPSLSLENVTSALQKEQLTFDRNGEEYYNTISALHKSIRGSDPHAALYWLARMLEAGQDPLYIARRLVRLASEDVGLAEPDALPQAIAALSACQQLGMPECNLALAQAVVFLARSPKSNALYAAYAEAAADVRKHGNLPVPLHIRNAVTPLMESFGYGKGYDYSHSPDGTKKEGICYLPEELKDKRYLSGNPQKPGL